MPRTLIFLLATLALTHTALAQRTAPDTPDRPQERIERQEGARGDRGERRRERVDRLHERLEMSRDGRRVSERKEGTECRRCKGKSKRGEDRRERVSERAPQRRKALRHPRVERRLPRR